MADRIPSSVNPALAQLWPYPFERLNALLKGAQPPAALPHISLGIGEPRHAPPAFILQALTEHLDKLGSYPVSAGLPQFRAAVASWLTRRFALPPGALQPDTMVLPANGTREALFAFVQAMTDRRQAPLVVMPNPFYQIYEGAALLAGAQPWYMGNDVRNEFLPDLDGVPPDVWQRCQILFLCSPGNPTGAVASLDYLRRALELADRYDFVVASDECYSEIYLDEANPPPGLLQAALAAGHHNFERCAVFHSLSKRSSVPGLRSGFVAGDPAVHQTLSAVPHVSRLRDADAHATGQHSGMERRGTRRREPPLVSREVRARAADPRRKYWKSAHRRPASICGRASPTTNASRANCSNASTSPCCPAVISPATASSTIPVAAGYACRWSRPCRNASRRRSGFANT